MRLLTAFLASASSPDTKNAVFRFDAEKSAIQDTGTVLNGVSLDIENYCTIRASPARQRRCLRFLSALQLKIKGRDCGTINGHNDSSSIRTLMKDAREALVR